MKKQQIMTLIIGILIGAVLTTAVFLVFKPGNSRKVPNFSQLNKDGQKFNPEDFKQGEGRSRRSRNNNSESDNSQVEDNKAVEDKQNEKQG